MSLTPAEIALVVEELRPLRGAVVQKAYAPRERFLVVELRVPGRSHLLALSAEPGRARLHVSSGRPPSPQEALPFQQQARSHLVGRALRGVELPSPRRVELRFEDAEGERCLEVELSGRTGNLVLTSGTGVVIATSGPPLPAGRLLGPGRPYEPLDDPSGPSPAASRFQAGAPFSVSETIERAYAERERAADLQERRGQVERPLRQKRDRLRRTITKVEAEADRTSAAEAHRVAGELLKVNLHAVQRGLAEVQLVDYSSGEAQPITVSLRPELSPQDNLAWHFRQYRRLSRGSERAAVRLAELRGELADLERELAALPQLDLEALVARTPIASVVTKAKSAQRPGERLPFREFVAPSGRRILVGKGSRENDTLSFKHARPNDLWLHARGLTGAHVVVPLEKGEVPPPELLLDACALAVHFSSAKGQSRVEVSYLPAKYLRKVKGAPGAVTYSQEKTLRYAHEPVRIARLLASRDE